MKSQIGLPHGTKMSKLKSNVVQTTRINNQSYVNCQGAPVAEMQPGIFQYPCLKFKRLRMKKYKGINFFEYSFLMVLHQLSGDMEITFQIRFCACRIIISAETFVKTATHRRCGKVLTNIPTEMDKLSSTKQAISEYRNSDFQISGSAISSYKNIHFLMEQNVEYR